jgi:hypothetical protein
MKTTVKLATAGLYWKFSDCVAQGQPKLNCTKDVKYGQELVPGRGLGVSRGESCLRRKQGDSSYYAFSPTCNSADLKGTHIPRSRSTRSDSSRDTAGDSTRDRWKSHGISAISVAVGLDRSTFSRL